mmetsp:Transcript_15916/g.36384  ORF Transcript_15916/g.36384 Transcript_15916/m.36384 type:complete len:98 (+) Transcript_15916:381-674(+)
MANMLSLGRLSQEWRLSKRSRVSVLRTEKSRKTAGLHCAGSSNEALAKMHHNFECVKIVFEIMCAFYSDTFIWSVRASTSIEFFFFFLESADFAFLS